MSRDEMVSELRERIKGHVLGQGRITFAEFMELALYCPGLGYYTSSRPRVGAAGDYFTSPATHPAFAALISLQLQQMWQLLGCPAEFTVVEMGAGKGLLAQDILAYLPQLSPRFAQSVNYIARERGSAAAPLPPGISGCFLSNELVDAFPTHRVAMRGGQLREVYVAVQGDDFVEVVDVPSTPLLEQHLAREGIRLPEGYCTEVNLNIAPWMKQVADSLERGFVITIDYGYPAAELYSPQRHRGTLVTYHRHMCGSDPYVRIGAQDITAHVDFTAVISSGESLGLPAVALLSQREFLMNLGLDVFLRALAERGLSYPQYQRNRFSMLELVCEEGLGDFKVLIQSKGLASAPLYCATPDNAGKLALQARQGTLEVPLLRAEHMPLLEGKYPDYAGIGSELFHGDCEDKLQDA